MPDLSTWQEFDCPGGVGGGWAVRLAVGHRGGYTPPQVRLEALNEMDHLPRIGLLSDSHGRAEVTRLGVRALLDAGVDLLIHLGDVGSVQVIDELVVHQPGTDQAVPVRLVFGNSDWDVRPLGDYATSLGLCVDHPVGRLKLDDGELVYCHGHQRRVMDTALVEGVKYLCHGHTHQAADDRRGPTRIINPGALCRAHRYTVAVLDTASDELTFLIIQPRS